MNLLKDLELKGRVCYNEPLSKHTTFRIGGPARIWAEAECPADIKGFFDVSSAQALALVLIGEGSNILADDKAALNIIAVRLSGGLEAFEFQKDRIACAAGCSLQRFILSSIEAGYSGLEFMAGIPGSIGGSLMMNAGSGSQGPWISDFVKAIKVMDNGRVKSISRAQAKFGYRESGLSGFVILGAEFNLKPSKDKNAVLEEYKSFLAEKKKRQELSQASAGCVFKNPRGAVPSAAKLIEACGLKGKTIGAAMVSPRHANFIVNTGNATFNDVMELIELIRDKVYKEHNIKLELEIKIVK